MKLANKTDWKVEPLSEDYLSMKIDRRFNHQQMSRIRMGLIPQVMEDRWFIYYEENTLYIHRSWTGYCIFVVRFNEFSDGSGQIYECLITRDKDLYQNVDEESDRILLHDLIYGHLLEEQ